MSKCQDAAQSWLWKYNSYTRLQDEIAWEETGESPWSSYLYDVLLARLDAPAFRGEA